MYSSPVGGRKLRIVVVEDRDDVREGMVELLAFYGHELAEAADGVSGAELIIDRRPDLALVDIGLPQMDGYEVARRVRAALGDTTRLVAITGYGQYRDRVRAFEAGFDAHYTKPVEMDKLLEILSARSTTPLAAAGT